MNAKKCDKCGGFYLPTAKEHDTIIIMKSIYSGPYTDKKQYDLCPDCMDDLKKWLNHKAIMLCRQEAGEVKK